MDVMKLKSHFSREMLSDILSKLIRKKTDVNINMCINEISISSLENNDDVYELHLNVNALMDKKEIYKMLKEGIK